MTEERERKEDPKRRRIDETKAKQRQWDVKERQEKGKKRKGEEHE